MGWAKGQRELGPLSKQEPSPSVVSVGVRSTCYRGDAYPESTVTGTFCLFLYLSSPSYLILG